MAIFLRLRCDRACITRMV